MKYFLLGLGMLTSLSSFANCELNNTSTLPMNGESNLCIGSSIITNSGLSGTVEAVFPNGRHMVKLVGYSGLHSYEANQLGRTAGCTSNKFCVDESIVTDSGLAGTIKAIQPNGEVSVRLVGYSGYHKYTTQQLFRRDGCLKRKLCVNDTVISTSGLRGTIKAVDTETQRAQVSLVGYSGHHKYQESDLGKTTGCNDYKYCVNDSVITESGLKGTIQAIFKNGNVSVKLVGYSGYHKYESYQIAVTSSSQENAQNTFQGE